MIYTFNAKGCILYPVMKSYFELSDDDVYKTIQDGCYVFEKLIPLLDKESTYSILCGDYIDLSSKYQASSQLQLRYEMNKVLSRCHESEYRYSS